MIKVGGSLFDLPDLAVRLGRLLRQLRGRRKCLVAGGGASANVVRELQRVHELSDPASHRIALESMRVGESFLCEIIPAAVLTASAADIKAAWQDGSTCVVQASTFLTTAPASNISPLAQDWSVTSDSIAAWVGTVLAASELLLVKSTPPPATLVGTDRVDDAFQIHSRSLDLQWCNLRTGCDIVPIKRQGAQS